MFLIISPKALKSLFLSWVLVAQPVILATQEAEIKRIKFRSQPGKIVLETLS
jgi:hypothetical protein